MPKSTVSCYHFNQNHFDIGNFSSVYIIIGVLNVPFSLMAAVGNSLILSVIWKVSSLRSPSKLLLSSLALTDLLVGIFVQPLFITYQFAKANRLGNLFCTSGVLFYVSSSCLGAVSLLTVAVISVDRYVALYYHLNYQEIVTTKRIGLFLAAIWVASFFLGTTWIWQSVLFKVGSVVIICLFIPLTSIAYYRIYRGLRHNHRIQPSHNKTPEAQTQAIPENSLNMARYRKSITNTLFVYCLLLLCYLPYLCTETVIIATTQTVLNQRALEFAFTIVFINSSLNPLVYCWRLRGIRVAVTETVRNIFERN